MKFLDIPGKKEEKQFLINQVQGGRIPHAQLFMGKEGFGGLPMALAFASYILCTEKLDNDSCGECAACKKASKNMHPDLHFSFPVVKYKDLKREETTSNEFLSIWRKALDENPFMSSNQWFKAMSAENTTPNINVKECNEVIRKLSLMSFESEYKILIMWLPEYLGKEGNRLLKLIEEPPAKTVIIFVTQNIELILPTILSRCQLIKLKPFEHDEIKEFLVNKLDVGLDKAIQVANMSEGNLCLAQSVSQNENNDFSEMLISWLRICYKSDPIELQAWYEGISKLTKDDICSFLEYGLHFFRQFLLWSHSGGQIKNLTTKEIEVIEKMSSVINAAKAEAIAHVIDAQIGVIYRNVNIKIMLLTDSLTIGDIMKGKESVTLHSYY